MEGVCADQTGTLAPLLPARETVAVIHPPYTHQEEVKEVNAIKQAFKSFDWSFE
jgi:hypothetical protein